MIRSAAILMLVAMPALAADKPAVAPQRDVDVTYQVAQPVAGGPPLTQRMRWSVSAGRLRVDPPTPGLYMIIDTRNRRMAMVKDADRAVLDLNTAAPGLPGATSDATFARAGTDQVAGLPCTNWRTTDAAHQPVLLCLTDDGVMLRASRGAQVLLEAIKVAYTSPDPAVFVPPDGYRHTNAGQP